MSFVRVIALALAVMVPSASLARGIGPADDAPIAERTPSARLLPSDSSAPTMAQETPRPYYARWWFWTIMGVTAAATIAAILFGAFVSTLHGAA